MTRRLLIVIAALALLPVSASADWTTYHADLSRTGVDTSGSVGPVVAGWTASGLDAPVYAEPLLVGHTLLVATENNTIYAFDDRLGTQLWSKNLATGLGQAVPSGSLPCGNVSLVGITGTPVVDTATGVFYAVGLIWDGTNASSIHYELFAADLNNSGALLWHEQVPASGTANFDPKIEGQRAALALTGGINRPHHATRDDGRPGKTDGRTVPGRNERRRPRVDIQRLEAVGAGNIEPTGRCVVRIPTECGVGELAAGPARECGGVVIGAAQVGGAQEEPVTILPHLEDECSRQERWALPSEVGVARIQRGVVGRGEVIHQAQAGRELDHALTVVEVRATPAAAGIAARDVDVALAVHDRA